MKIASRVDDVRSAQQDNCVQFALLHLLLHLGDLAPIPVGWQAVGKIRGRAAQPGGGFQLVSPAENRHVGSEGQSSRCSGAAEKAAASGKVHGIAPGWGLCGQD